MGLPQICLQTPGKALPAFVRAICRSTPRTLGEREDFLDDPEKVEYLDKLLEAYYQSQAVVTCYNVAVFGFVLFVSVLYWRETRRDKNKCRRLRHRPPKFSQGTTPPSESLAKHLDVERTPLLPGNKTQDRSRCKSAINRAVSSWLARQSPPLPVVNKTLPSNGTSLFVLAWLALNVFFQFFRLPLDPRFFFIFADRIGFLFIVNLPLLYLLSAKNQPLRFLTGYSYEALNIFHRRLGEWMCFIGVVHFITMAAWHLVLADDWLAAESVRAYFTHPVVLFGIGTFVAYESLYFTSLASFRQRWYEFFLASHVLLQVAALAFLWFHFETSRPYVAVSLAIFLADRLVWRLTLKRADITADLTVLDKDTLLLSADWDIPGPHKPNYCRWWWCRWQPRCARNQSILHGWHPTDHVFLTAPTLAGARFSALQSHPFTIASAAPGRSTSPSPHSPEFRGAAPTHAWLALLIRARDGFTRDLLRYGLSSSSSSSRLAVRLDGPYGSPRALRVLRASGCAVLVAGGSGIAVVFPLAWALLCGGGDEDGEDAEVRQRQQEEEGANGDGGKALGPGYQQRRGRRSSMERIKRRVHLLWVTHSRAHREWVPAMQLAELKARGLDLVMPEPTEEAGRPDVDGLVGGWIEGAEAEGREVGVVVSGPDGLNRTVRNVCADAIGRGRDVRVVVEKFGW
ncbi:hypothetical protein VTK26DRAFT_1880 [Humicola hyalothermophila]